MDDSYADNSGVSMDDDTELQVTLELVPNGFIINSNVFLTHQQWHTVYLVSEDFRRCAVCGVYCDVADHIASSRHIENMERYKPLNKYDLSITRKIKSYYHCGVCNELFNETQQPEHYSSKTHENNLLFAINRVSDIMYDSNIHDNTQKKDSYYFNANYGQASHMLDEPIDDDDDEFTDDEWEPVNHQEYRDDENYSDEEFCDEPMQNLEFSYASMARKPKGDDLPDVLEVDLGNKKVTVRFNSWNMLIRTTYNRFYCMACKDVYHVRKRGEHCRSEEHLGRLDACTVVDRYEKFFVRQVDEKCYHCGHCNNLQLIDAMEDHIHSYHTQPTTVQALLDSPSKKKSSPVKTNPKTKNEDTKTKNEETKTINEETKTKNEVKAYINPAMVFDGLKAANSNFDDLVICTFGSNIRISKLSFNIICQGVSDFYCGLCEVNIVRELLGCHLMDVQHLTRLQRTPFILAFNVHLFRQIREALHCGLCNELIQIMPEFIIKHKYLEKHIVSMYKAVGTFKNDNKYQYNFSRDQVRDTPKLLDASVPKHIPKADNMTLESNDTAITKLAVNIPAPNINTKIVPVNKNISIAKVNSNKNEPSNINKNITKNIQSNKNIVKENEIKLEDKEFIVVKHGIKEQESDLDDSYIEDFDLEEYVYVKLGNNYIKITNASYNSLIDVGDGTKYCFVCSSVVWELRKHVESRGHTENMEKIKFVDKYNEDLLRQFYLMYHCSICNVVITRKQLNHHLSWPTHALQTENTKISSKKRKNEIKTGTRQITVATQKENIYLNEREADIKIYLHITIEKDNKVERMNKIVIFNDNVFKVTFDFWHGLSEMNSGYRCKVCQCDFDARELGQHVASEWHVGSLEKIEKQYSPALIRKINDATLNCIMCNTELSNKKHIIKEHIQGKKHIKNYEVMLKESSVAYSYTDCDQEVVTL